MANKKKQPDTTGADRKARVEALKKQQKAAERKKTYLVIGIATLVGGALIAIPTVQILKEKKEEERAITGLGIPIGLAGCDVVQVDPAPEGSGEHVGEEVTVDYKTIPPAYGAHFGAPATINSRGFYTADDRPRIEQLVHNLEHGYTIAWYLPTTPQGELDDLKELTSRLRDDLDTLQIIAAPWDVSRGAFPAGKNVAFTHWGATQGYRQYCKNVSGEALQTFMANYPASDAPEPNIP
ncbi:MAG: DUF3105 domain-containing protein [Sporichthyaceae bacterium]